MFLFFGGGSKHEQELNIFTQDNNSRSDLIFGYYLCPLYGLIQRGKSVVYDNNSSIIVAIIGETENATG